MIDVSDARQLIGQTLDDSDGGKVGKIGQVYLDETRGLPEWVTVHTGLFGTNESFVPLAEATKTENGLQVPYSKKQIQAAPNIDSSAELTEAQEQGLYEYYDVAYTTEGSTFADVGGVTQNQTQNQTRDQTRDQTRTQAQAPADGTMTRSEERLDVGTEKVETGRARLHKWVETENVQLDVPVKKEKARLVTEPVTDADRNDATIGEAEHEVTLNEERATVSKETVPVERVRVDKEVVEDTETVTDDVRKERIDLDGADTTNPSRDQR